MIFIAHRGNLFGPQPDKENTISYIDTALQNGFAVEVDVIDYNDKGIFTLGHDNKQEEVDVKYITQKNLFAHAKNYNSLT